MRAARCIDHLPGHANAAASLAHAAFEHITHAKLAADLLHVHGAALVGEGRVARDDEQPVDAGKARDDVVDHPVGEIRLLRIAAQVRERQNGDGGLFGQCECQCGAGDSRRVGNVCDNGRSDVAVAAPGHRFDPALGIRRRRQHPAQGCDPRISLRWAQCIPRRDGRDIGGAKRRRPSDGYARP